MTKPTHNAAAAQARYRELQEELAEVLGQITTGLGRHAAETDGRPNWAHVGDLGHYAEQLRDVRDALHELGEYAPENAARRKR